MADTSQLGHALLGQAILGGATDEPVAGNTGTATFTAQATFAATASHPYVATAQFSASASFAATASHPYVAQAQFTTGATFSAAATVPTTNNHAALALLGCG